MRNLSANLPVYDSTNLVAKLKHGSAALFPTDTVPALAALPKFASKLWKIKNRPVEKPLILMGANPEDLLDFVAPCALHDATEIASQYWPGPLTMALPISRSPYNALNRVSDTIGMRVPGSLLARRLLFESGPLATTSANLSGESPCLRANEISKTFPDLPLLGPVPWPKPSGMASTVIVWEELGVWRLIRRGSIIPEISFVD